MIENILENLAQLITQNLWLAPVLAVLAGVITAFTPCSVSSIPLVIGYVGGADSKNPKKAFLLSATFATGMAVTYTALGVVAALLGSVLQNMGKWWYLFLGVLMVLMALQTWEIFNFIPSAHLTGKAKKKGFLGAFLAGILGGIFASPCATPVLVVLLGVVAKGGNVAWGVLLLLLYSLGNSTLILLVGTFVGFVKKLKENPKYGVFSNILKYASGGVILLIGLYMFYLGF